MFYGATFLTHTVYYVVVIHLSSHSQSTKVDKLQYVHFIRYKVFKSY